MPSDQIIHALRNLMGTESPKDPRLRTDHFLISECFRRRVQEAIRLKMNGARILKLC
jgi:hypothetical protein